MSVISYENTSNRRENQMAEILSRKKKVHFAAWYICCVFCFGFGLEILLISDFRARENQL